MKLKSNLVIFFTLFVFGCGGGGGGGASPEIPDTPDSPFLLTLSNNTSFNVDEDNILNGSIAATSSESVTLSYAVTSQPSHATVELGSNGDFSFTPNNNFFGSDSFSYTVTAVGKNVSKSATVNITVNPINDPPSIVLSQLDGWSENNKYPLKISSGFIEIEFNIDDVDNDLSSLNIQASSDQGSVSVIYDSSLSTSSATLDLSQINLAGKLDVNIFVTDGEATRSEKLTFWNAIKIDTQDNNNVYTLFGDDQDQSRKTGMTLLFDSFSDISILNGIRESLTEFIRFIGENELDMLMSKFFNVNVIEYPTQSTSVLGVETGCDDRDEDIFCGNQEFIDLVISESQKYFSNTNSYTVVTGVDGRGVAFTGQKISIQSITSSAPSAIRGVINTMKHEFGHIFMDLGDEYTSDYNVNFECIDSSDLVDLNCGQVDMYGNISSQTLPNYLRWKHHIPDINNVNGFDNLTSTDGIGMYEGSYWGTDDTFRASYQSIMNGLGSGYANYIFNGVSSEGVQYNKIGQEIFEIEALINQGLHDISAGFDNDRNVVVGHGIVVSESDYTIDWYIDGVLDASLQNNSTVTITRKDSGITSAAYRIVPLGDTKIIGTDDPNIFRDFYDGLLSSFDSLYYCTDLGVEAYSNVEAYNNPFCRFTGRVWVEGGSSFIVNEENVEEAMSYSNVLYLFELSGLGAQFVIRWENMP